MKKFGAAALALTLAGSMTLPALAVETPVLISAKVGYSTNITLNGETLDTAALPAASDSMLPLRLLAESDHGSAYWDQEGNEAWFNFGQDKITVNFDDNTILVNDELVKEKAEVTAGVTYVSSGVLALLDGFTVTWADPTAENFGAVDITTRNNDPMVKLAYSIMESSEMFGSRTYEDTLTEAYKIPVDQFDQIVAFFPMITSPDTVIIGKLAEGADEKAVTDALEAYRQSQEDTFSWYLAQHLPKVQDARVEVEGDYILFLIGENADAGVEAFRTGVASL